MGANTKQRDLDPKFQVDWMRTIAGGDEFILRETQAHQAQADATDVSARSDTLRKYAYRHDDPLQQHVNKLQNRIAENHRLIQQLQQAQMPQQLQQALAQTQELLGQGQTCQKAPTTSNKATFSNIKTLNQQLRAQQDQINSMVQPTDAARLQQKSAPLFRPPGL